MNEPTTAGLLLHDNDDDAVAAAAAGDDDEGVGGGGWSSRAVTPASAGGSSSKKTFQRLWVFLYSRGSRWLSVLVFGGRCYFGPVAFLILIRVVDAESRAGFLLCSFRFLRRPNHVRLVSFLRRLWKMVHTLRNLELATGWRLKLFKLIRVLSISRVEKLGLNTAGR